MANIADISELVLQLGLSAAITETERAIAQEALRYAEAGVKRYLKYDPVQAVHTEFYPQMDLSSQDRAFVWEVSATDAYQRRLAGAATSELQITHLPVRQLDENGANAIDLRIDYDGRSGARSGSFAAATQKTEGVEFHPNYDMVDSNSQSVCNDGLIRSEGIWPSIAGSVKITYVAGYTDAELHGQDSVINAAPILDAVLGEAVVRVQRVYSRMKNGTLGFVPGVIKSETLGDYKYVLDASSSGSVSTVLYGGGWDILPETAQKLQDFVRYDIGVM